MGSKAAYRLAELYDWEEKMCCRCKEWWPADEEFFRILKKGTKEERFHAWCRCCELEYNAEWKVRRQKERRYEQI